MVKRRDERAFEAGAVIERLRHVQLDGGVASFTRRVTITAPMSIGSQKLEKIEQHSATMEIHAKPLRYVNGFIMLIGFWFLGLSRPQDFVEEQRHEREKERQAEFSHECMDEEEQHSGENDPPEQSFKGHGCAGSLDHASEDTDDRCAKHGEGDDLEPFADRRCIGDSVARRSRF